MKAADSSLTVESILPRNVVLLVDNHRTVLFMDKHVGWNFTTPDIMVVSSTASLCNLLRKKLFSS